MSDKKLPLPKLAIFDMDGLLFDTEALFQRTKAVVMKKYGYEQRPGDYEKTLGTCGDTLNRILHELYGEAYPADTISQETRKLVNQYIDVQGPPVKPGIPTLLAWFQEHHVPCCVASSTRTDIVKKYLAQAELNTYFSFVIGGDQVSHSKPNPEIFLKACAQAQTDPEQALVLEDSQNGVLAAINGNIPVICIPDVGTPEDEVLKKTAAVVSSAADVPSLFT